LAQLPKPTRPTRMGGVFMKKNLVKGMAP
jgi:hypothetical protein